MIRFLCLVGLIGLYAPGPAAARPGTGGEPPSPPALRHNPFARTTLPEGSARARPQTSVAAPRDWSPNLRATVLAGPRSMVNVDGEMVLVGEEIDGFRLVEVRERVAVFERDGDQRVLTLE